MDDESRPSSAGIEIASLVGGPALMSLGDLFHPAESADAATQVAIVAATGARWYVAHLLLFIGLLLFIPGVLALTRLAAERMPRTGRAAQFFMLASVGALSAVFVFEMLLGRLLSDGADVSTAVSVLETFQSPGVFGALIPGLLSFFVGTALMVVPLASASGAFRWPALGFGLGALLILGEIVLSEVLMSQIGNVVILLATVGFARVLLGGQLTGSSRSSAPSSSSVST